MFLLKLLYDAPVALGLVIYPEYQFLPICFRHGDLLQLSCLDGTLQIVIVDEKISKGQDENFFLLGKFREIFNLIPSINLNGE